MLGRIGSILSVGNSIFELKFGRFWDRDSGHFWSVFGVGPRTKVAPNRSRGFEIFWRYVIALGTQPAGSCGGAWARDHVGIHGS
ncbi:Leucine-rich repeat protein kinase family protein [Prunus dulcis]|uniref:Leucine-rich repeat protein kinase family protein n=1 Tax=Prunus dulcis TaxID=3755 RepID=A0A4Y1R6I9_PRUDU|nr:Leucine-rich repeat protein kinase family protein [Prunus dulcis]